MSMLHGTAINGILLPEDVTILPLPQPSSQSCDNLDFHIILLQAIQFQRYQLLPLLKELQKINVRLLLAVVVCSQHELPVLQGGL
jgi:hypothetical protein